VRERRGFAGGVGNPISAGLNVAAKNVLNNITFTFNGVMLPVGQWNEQVGNAKNVVRFKVAIGIFALRFTILYRLMATPDSSIF
jgi:hypothetical protein